MSCYAPLKAYYSAERNPDTGKRSLVFDMKKALETEIGVRVPCGQCIGCKLEKARQWAMRIMHEAKVSSSADFLTLTYEDMPEGCSLSRRDMQLFMKRFRKWQGDGIRFYGCGEYGGRTWRPHYHVIIFNGSFRDKRKYKLAPGGEQLWYSRELEKCWGKGFCVIGDVTFQSAAYVARYCCEKKSGEGSELYYMGREREFAMMSLKPGIGRDYFVKHGLEIMQHDDVVMNGRTVRPPRYYDAIIEKFDPDHLEAVKLLRKQKAFANAAENTPERRRVRERVVMVNLARVKRNEV